MLDAETKRRIDSCRDILVGKVPDPKSQVEQITIALIYKFMDDMDAEAEELGGKRSFFAGDHARFGWARLMAPSLGGFEVLALYSEAIQKMNENPGVPELFRDIFKNAYLPYRDPETLKSFLKEINYFTYDHSERLGDAFEYLLSVLGSQGDAGQFRTPRHIIDFMVEVLNPKKNETILDPACGTAGFLISAWKHILKANTSKTIKNDSASRIADAGRAGDLLTPDERARLAASIHGYDISPDMVRLSLVNLYLHGFTHPRVEEYDTLTQDDKWNEVADVILANPPFMSPKGGYQAAQAFQRSGHPQRSAVCRLHGRAFDRHRPRRHRRARRHHFPEWHRLQSAARDAAENLAGGRGQPAGRRVQPLQRRENQHPDSGQTLAQTVRQRAVCQSWQRRL